MDYEALARRLASHPQDFPKIFMACGTEDFLYQVNVAYRDFLKQQGAEVTFMEGPGGHDWGFLGYLYSQSAGVAAFRR